MAPRKKQHPRRKPGSGTIRFKQRRALPWEATYPLGHEHYRYSSFATREEAETWLDRLYEDATNKDRPRNIAGGSQRLDVYLTAHLSRTRPHVAPKTYLSYEYYCNLAVGYFGGARRIDTIARDDADEMLLHFAYEGFQNVAQLRAALKLGFNYAEDEKYIPSNPFTKAKAPPVERRSAIALTERQRAGLLDAAQVEDRMRRDKGTIPLCPLWHIYSRLGCRKGEGIALLWADVKMTEDGPTITFREQYTNVGSKTVKSRTTKTKKPRTVPAPLDLYDLLMELKHDQIARAASDPDWKNHGLVFCDAHGYPLSVWYVQNRWAKLRKRAPIPQDTVIHDLRHTADYLMEARGVPRSARMAIIGHSTIAMDRHYTDHADMEAMRRAVNGA